MNTLDALLAAARTVEIGLETYDRACANVSAANRRNMLADDWTDADIDAIEASQTATLRDARETTKRELWAWALSLPIEALTRRSAGDGE